LQACPGGKNTPIKKEEQMATHTRREEKNSIVPSSRQFHERTYLVKHIKRGSTLSEQGKKEGRPENLRLTSPNRKGGCSISPP